MLFVAGNGSATGWGTTTPLRAIQEQAAAAGIELPEPVVEDDCGFRWTEITCVEAFKRPEDENIRATIYGHAETHGTTRNHTDALTPGQILQLCDLVRNPDDPMSVARWSPTVTLLLHKGYGTEVTIEAGRVESIIGVANGTSEYTQVEYRAFGASHSYYHVTEPKPLVDAMLAACATEEATDAGAD